MHWFASLYAWSTHRFGNFLKRSLQSVSKGSRDKLAIEFFISWTTTKASSSTIRLCMFSIAAMCNLSWKTHSSAITLFTFPQFLAIQCIMSIKSSGKIYKFLTNWFVLKRKRIKRIKFSQQNHMDAWYSNWHKFRDKSMSTKVVLTVITIQSPNYKADMYACWRCSKF